MDPLSHILKSLHLEGGFFLNAEFTAPWCVFSTYGTPAARARVGGGDHMLHFHFVIEGTCKVRLSDGSSTFCAAAGDVILFRDGEDHLIGSDLHLEPRDFSRPGFEAFKSKTVLHVREGGGGELTRFVCGYFFCNRNVCKALLDVLPPVTRIPVGSGTAVSTFTQLLQMGVGESSTARAGAGSVLVKLSELLFIEAMRRYLDELPSEERGWLAGARDAQVGRVLALLHNEPARNWTVDELASEVALSRSALAGRFSALIGTSPIQYLTRLRLAVASRELRRSNESIARIAQRNGYDSEAAFNRAFKREFGSPPSTWRKAVRSGGLVAQP